MKTTLNKIREHSPCGDGWAKLLRNLGKTKADDEPLAITTILDSNGLDDALWCLRIVDGHEMEIRLMAVDFARSVQHLMKDERSIKAVDVAERYANGQATKKELVSAKYSALDAARDAAKDAAWDAARDAAWAAARAAARAAAVAASAAVSDAAKGTAWLAAWGAADAAGAAAWAAADWDDAREVQADYLRIVCAEIEQRGVEK